ncbi:MAG: hypothetical protein WC992_05905 [Acholeplasmataceae bacterium]
MTGWNIARDNAAEKLLGRVPFGTLQMREKAVIRRMVAAKLARRVARGVYQLTPRGRREMNRHTY